MIKIAKTSYGKLSGVEMEGYTVFKGIPYAKPPVGELRWKLPEKPDAWEGVRAADQFGNITWQTLPTAETPWGAMYYKEFYSNPDFIPEISEDCLYLNVWTPAASPDEKLPVAFWIHGGGFGGGYSSEIEFDGEEYCKRGVILVTINYRCGVFGFLAHPWLTAESDLGISGNYGSFDQIAALNWVYENIAAFGGDPERITVFGQSAGCMSTQVLVSSGLTGDKIKGAILQSGVETTGVFLTTPTLEKAEEFGKRIVKITKAKDLAELRAMDPSVLNAAKEQFDMEVRLAMMNGTDTEEGDGLRIVPNVDGYLLKKNVREVFAEGAMKKIPYMAGCVQDDLGTTDEDRKNGVPGKLLERCREWCEKADELQNPPAYAYLFRRELPGEGKPDVSFHSSELWYTFGTLGRCWRPMEEHDFALSEKMVDLWTSFIKNGKPEAEGCGWRPCTKDDPYVEIFE